MFHLCKALSPQSVSQRQGNRIIGCMILFPLALAVHILAKVM